MEQLESKKPLLIEGLAFLLALIVACVLRSLLVKVGFPPLLVVTVTFILFVAMVVVAHMIRVHKFPTATVQSTARQAKTKLAMPAPASLGRPNSVSVIPVIVMLLLAIGIGQETERPGFDPQSWRDGIVTTGLALLFMMGVVYLMMLGLRRISSSAAGDIPKAGIAMMLIATALFVCFMVKGLFGNSHLNAQQTTSFNVGIMTVMLLIGLAVFIWSLRDHNKPAAQPTTERTEEYSSESTEQ